MLLLAACGRTDGRAIESIAGNAMGTTYQVKYLLEGNSGAPAKAALEEGIVEILSEIDRQMSTYRSDSDLSRFNASRSTDWYPVPADLLTVLSTAALISKRSGGAFDVTVKPLVDLWGFGSQRPPSPAVPHSDAVAAARARVGHEHLSIRREPAAIRKDIPDLEVDLGAIAPGYAVDRIARFLSDNGVNSYLVELGGEVFGRGRRPDGRGWQVGIERPTDTRREVDISLELDGKGLSVSGGYRNYFERNGTRYSHELDPVTAAPVSHRTMAVAVVADTVMEADAWSTALLVLGSARGHDLATRQGIAARFATLGPQGVESRATPAFESATLLPAQ
jgi:thiamine biosynthesis lipoprotein